MTGTGTGSGLDAGTYEVLRDRLGDRADELARRAGALNNARITAFGSTELALAGAEHIRTERNVVARDIIAVGDALLVGYEAPASDVLALYDRDLNRLPDETVPGLLDDPAFVHEFDALHRYFQGARLLQLRHVDGKLLAVFRTGEQADDIRVLRWSLPPSGEVRFLDARGSVTTSSLRRTTSPGPRRAGTITSWGATRTSPSPTAHSSSRRWAAPSP